MSRKLLASCAVFALGCFPGYAAGWYPGFTGTGQVAPTGTAGATTTSYTGPGDLDQTGHTNQRFFSMRAWSAQAASLGVYLFRVCGSSFTNGASVTTCKDIQSLPSGLPDASTIGPLMGTAANNPCFTPPGASPADGYCRIAKYDQIAQIAAGVAGTSGPILTQGTVTNNPALYQNCQNNPQVTTTITTMCEAYQTKSFMDSTVNSSNNQAQPYLVAGLFQRPSGSVSKINMYAFGSTVTEYGNTVANTWQGNAGTAFNVSVTDNGTPVSFSLWYNGASSNAQVNAGASQTVNPGTNAAGPSWFVGQLSTGSGSASLIGWEQLYSVGTWSQAQQLAYANNQKAFYGF